MRAILPLLLILALMPCGLRPAIAAPEEPEPAPLNVEIRTQLEFSRAVSKGSGGIVSIDPDSGARRVSGTLVDLGGGGFAGSAIVTGEPGRAVRIDMPTQIRMTSANGSEIEITKIRTNLTPAPRLDPFGKLEFAFGGDLIVRGNVTGTFRGRIPITAQYE